MKLTRRGKIVFGALLGSVVVVAGLSVILALSWVMGHINYVGDGHWCFHAMDVCYGLRG